MDLDQLRGFIETAREKSFTRAAEKLFLTQPAVSLQIKALEEELGERLFERRGKRVSLTEAGRLLFSRAEEILGMVELVRQDLMALGELKVGRLCIGTSDTNCAYVLPPAVKAFRQAYPDIEIRLTDRMSPEVVRLVMEGTVDFGLATLPVSEPRVETLPLFARKDVVICAPAHPLGKAGAVALEDMAVYPMLMLEQGATSRGLTDRMFAEAGVVPKVAMELGSIEVIKRFVEIGLGVALAPEVAICEEVAAGRLLAVPLKGAPVRQVGVIRRVGSHFSPAARVFLDFLEKHLPETLSPP